MTTPTRSRSHSGRPQAQNGGSRSPQPSSRRRESALRQRQVSPSRASQRTVVSRKQAQRSARPRGRRSAAQKAYARRAQRSDATLRGRGPRATAPQGLRSLLALRLPTSRAGFVLMMMGLLGAGVMLSMWLSTQAIADSYRLESMREETASLAERTERLQREVSRQQTASSLAERAQELGMVRASDPARILVPEKGKPKLFGEPKEAQPAPEPSPARQQDREEARNPQEAQSPSRAGERRDGLGEQARERRDRRSTSDQQQVRAAATRWDSDEAAGG